MFPSCEVTPGWLGLLPLLSLNFCLTFNDTFSFYGCMVWKNSCIWKLLVIGKIRQLYGGRKKKVIKTKVRKKHHAYKYTKRMSKLWIYYLLVYELWTNSVKTRLWTSGIMWRIRNDDLLNQTQKAASYIQWSASFFGI